MIDSQQLADLRPIHDRVLLQRIEEEPSGTIIIPESAKQHAHKGIVVAVGDGKRLSDQLSGPMQVKVGDIVMYQSADIETPEFMLLQEADILGIITSDEALRRKWRPSSE